MGWFAEVRPIVRMWDLSLWEKALRGGLSEGSRVSEKTSVNSEQLDRQPLSRIEPGTSRLLRLDDSRRDFFWLKQFELREQRGVAQKGNFKISNRKWIVGYIT